MENIENSTIVNALNEMKEIICDEMKQSISQVEQNLNQRMDEKIEQLSQSMDQKINQLNQSILILSKSQDLLFEQNKALDKKIDDKFNYLDNKIDALEEKFDKKFDTLEKKFDKKLDALNKKVDNNSANIIKILNTISKMQKDIVDLRDDIETVYSLEKDSRKQLKKLL